MTNIPQTNLSAEAIILRIQQELPRLREEYAVDRLAIFGSYARNEQKDDSDVDILVSFRITPGLVKYITLEQHLSDILHKPVDLVMESVLKPDIAERIYKEVQPI